MSLLVCVAYVLGLIPQKLSHSHTALIQLPAGLVEICGGGEWEILGNLGLLWPWRWELGILTRGTRRRKVPNGRQEFRSSMSDAQGQI